MEIVKSVTGKRTSVTFLALRKVGVALCMGVAKRDGWSLNRLEGLTSLTKMSCSKKNKWLTFWTYCT